MVWFGFFVKWHINSFKVILQKAILQKEQSWYYLTHSWEDKGFHTFPKGICPKVKVIAPLEYELAYNDSAVHRFNHYTTRTPLFIAEVRILFFLRVLKSLNGIIKIQVIMICAQFNTDSSIKKNLLLQSHQC